MSRLIPKLQNRTRLTAKTAVSIAPPKHVSAGWIIRLRVANVGPPGTFAANLTRVVGTRSPVTGLPVALAWRNGDAAAEMQLDRGTNELLRLAIVRTKPTPGIVLLSAARDERFAKHAALPTGSAILLSFTVRHVETGRVLTDEHVEITFDPNDPELAPVVTFSATGTLRADQLPAAPAPAPPKPIAPTAPRAHVAAAAPAAAANGAPAGWATRDTTGRGAESAAAVAASADDLAPRSLSPVDAQYLRDVLRCSVCRSAYEITNTEIVCAGCGSRYPVVDGIPVLNKETTIGTLLEETDYDEIGGVNDTLIRGVGRDWRGIIEGLGIEANDVLEIGSGTGALTRGLAEQQFVGSLTATDVSLKFLRTLARRCDPYETPIRFVVGDANEGHFRSEAFDVVVGRSILHHLLHYEVTLQQCYEVLRPGGAAIFFEPILQGKIFLTLFMGLILRADEQSANPQLLPIERGRIERTMNHHMKSKLYPQDLESLARLEDKYVFDIDELQEVGRAAGFTQVEFRNNGTLTPTYWPYLASVVKSAGVPIEKIEPYRWIGEEFARTYGFMFADRLATPMAYFVFRK